MNSKEFEALFKSQYTILCRYAFQLVHDKDIAEDIIQDLFTYLWENQQKLNIHSTTAYLFKAAKNRAINYLKSSVYMNRLNHSNLNENAATTDDTDEWINQKELQTVISKSLEELPERCHAIFYMKRFENLSYKEIAAKLSITEKTVENQMTIAIGKIADYLDKHWDMH